MGLERLAAILQGVHSNFETDILRTIMTKAEELTGVTYGSSEKQDTSLRILADHARAVTFMVADGILPSNEGRGYVLRRILRRAVRHGRLLGRTEPFFSQVVNVVIEQMGDAYPEIVEHRELIMRITDAEEARFGTTLRQGLAFLDEAIEDLTAAGGTVLDGEKAFVLHDTYGFPLELTSEIAAERGISVDMDTFEREMEAQRTRARSAVKDESWSAFGGVLNDIRSSAGATEFVGYQHDASDATVVGIVADGEPVTRIEAGMQAQVVLDRTPFYGEQGGQVGDTGTLATASGAVFRVDDTTIPVPGLVVHHGTLEAGTFENGEAVHAAIDVLRRERIRRNHTATHVLHWALRLVLGEHVKQSGSFVAPERMRFDFTHFEAPTAQQLAKVERMANAKIMENHPVRAYETSLSSAREAGVTALFGEKYGEFVRVLEVGNFSKELCGGTHVSRSSEIGLLKIVSEGSVGANLRRIEAVTSFDALEYVEREEQELLEAAVALKVQRFDVSERVISLVGKVKDLETAAERTTQQLSEGDVAGLLDAVVDAGYPLLVREVAGVKAKGLRSLSDILRTRMNGGAVVLATVDPDSGKPLLLAAGSDASVAAGFDAGAVIRAMAPKVGGGGGGTPAMAQAGGSDASGVEAALAAAREVLGIGE